MLTPPNFPFMDDSCIDTERVSKFEANYAVLATAAAQTAVDAALYLEGAAFLLLFTPRCCFCSSQKTTPHGGNGEKNLFVAFWIKKIEQILLEIVCMWHVFACICCGVHVCMRACCIYIFVQVDLRGFFLCRLGFSPLVCSAVLFNFLASMSAVLPHKPCKRQQGTRGDAEASRCDQIREGHGDYGSDRPEAFRSSRDPFPLCG
jgi:hypothetical protein